MSLTIERNKDLSGANSLRLTAQAEYFSKVQSIADWREALAWAKSGGLPITLLGGGSNVVLAPRIEGLVLHPANTELGLEREDTESVFVRVGAGHDWDRFVRACVDRAWYGLENLVSIPGSCGAAPVQNIGAYGVDLADWVHAVTCIDMNTGEVFDRSVASYDTTA